MMGEYCRTSYLRLTSLLSLDQSLVQKLPQLATFHNKLINSKTQRKIMSKYVHKNLCKKNE